MKLIRLFLLLAVLAGCSPKPEIQVTGTYAADKGVLIENLDLAEGGAAMHKISVVAPEDQSVVSAVQAVMELGGAKWSLENKTVKVTGTTEHSRKNGTEVVYVFDIQPNGDLVRHNGEGQFVRFLKR